MGRDTSIKTFELGNVATSQTIVGSEPTGFAWDDQIFSPSDDAQEADEGHKERFDFLLKKAVKGTESSS